jgi:hypothetical protein
MPCTSLWAWYRDHLVLGLAFLLLAFEPLTEPRAEPPPERAPAPAPFPARNGGYVHLSPGFGGFTPIADAVLPMWTVGVAAGWHFEARRLTSQLGLYFDDNFLLEDPRAHELHGGLELRLGVMDRPRPTVFAYGLGRIGCVANYFTHSPWIWMTGLVGAGGQIFFARHLSAGIEAGLGFGGEASFQLRARGLIGVWF